jgi:processive 1,2-diacylglycerol beta-glucosyltransferase
MTMKVTMRKFRLLVLSVSAGTGHVRAAEALRVGAATLDAETLHIDVMDHVAPAFRALYTDAYLKLVKHHPTVWPVLYRIIDRTPANAPLARVRRAIERLNTQALRNAITAFAPDAVICTHFLPAELLMRERRRQRIACPVFVVVTDFDVHGMCVVPDMAGYFAANDEVAFRMQARGIGATAIHATGIPITSAFAVAQGRAQCAAEFGIEGSRSDCTGLSRARVGRGTGSPCRAGRTRTRTRTTARRARCTACCIGEI